MSGKKLFLVGLLCVALVALILLALTSAYIAVSYRWLLVPLGVWAAAMLVFHFRKKDGCLKDFPGSRMCISCIPTI